MTFIGLLLMIIAVVFWVQNLQKARKERLRPKSEGERLENKYIIEHEKKREDDASYEEYLDWCKFQAELPLEKSEFEAYRLKEWKLEKKVKNAMK